MKTKMLPHKVMRKASCWKVYYCYRDKQKFYEKFSDCCDNLVFYSFMLLLMYKGSIRIPTHLCNNNLSVLGLRYAHFLKKINKCPKMEGILKKGKIELESC